MFKTVSAAKEDPKLLPVCSPLACVHLQETLGNTAGRGEEF